MKKNLQMLFTVICAVVLTFAMVPNKVEAAPDNTAFLAYADESWTYQYWGDPSDAGVVATEVEVTGVGQYTVGLDFTGTEDGKAAGLAFSAPMIANGTEGFPGFIMTIDSIEINGSDIEISKGYSNDEEGNLRANIYNEWVSELPDDARTTDGSIDDASAIIVDREAFAEVETIAVTFTLSEGDGAAPEDTPEAPQEEYVAPSEFTAFLMYSAAENDWSVFEAIEGVNTTKILGDGTYTVTLKGSDIGATGQPDTAQVFCVDIPELATAMLSLGKNINNYNDAEEHGLPTDLEVSVEVYVDGNKVKTKSENLNYGDIEEKGTFRIEIYNIWGLHGASIVNNPPVFPENILPESEISVTFRIMGTGFNTEAALEEEAAKAETDEEVKEEPASTEETPEEDKKDGISTGAIVGIVVVVLVIVAGVVVFIMKKKSDK